MNHALPNLALPPLSPFKPIREAVVILHRLNHLIATRHHKRAVLYNGLLKRHAGHKDEARGLLRALLDARLDAVALGAEHHIMILVNRPRYAFGRENRGSLQRVRECVPPPRKSLFKAPTRLDREIEQPDRGICELLQRIGAERAAGDDLNADFSVCCRSSRNFSAAQVAVARLAGLKLSGEVDPKLHADVGRAVGVLLRHFGVHDPATGGHELQVALVYGAAVAGEIFVVDGAREEVGDCFLAAGKIVSDVDFVGLGEERGCLPMRMVRETCAWWNGKVVKHQEGREVAQLRRADGAAHAGACTLRLLNGQERFLDLAWRRRGQWLVRDDGEATEGGCFGGCRRHCARAVGGVCVGKEVLGRGAELLGELRDARKHVVVAVVENGAVVADVAVVDCDCEGDECEKCGENGLHGCGCLRYLYAAERWKRREGSARGLFTLSLGAIDAEMLLSWIWKRGALFFCGEDPLRLLR